MSNSEYEQLRLLVVGLAETILRRVGHLELRLKKLEEQTLEHRPTEPPSEPPTMDL